MIKNTRKVRVLRETKLQEKDVITHSKIIRILNNVLPSGHSNLPISIRIRTSQHPQSFPMRDFGKERLKITPKFEEAETFHRINKFTKVNANRRSVGALLQSGWASPFTMSLVPTVSLPLGSGNLVPQIVANSSVTFVNRKIDAFLKAFLKMLKTKGVRRIRDFSPRFQGAFNLPKDLSFETKL
jgi:hypothetical protein